MINNKFKMVFLSVITLGLIWIKWKKKIEHKKNTFYQVDNLPFKIESLIEFLGEDNYELDKQMPSRVVLKIKDIDKVQLEKIQGLKGVSGLFVKSSVISIILGVYSTSVYNALLNKNKG